MNTKQIEELRLIWNQENGAIAFHDLLEKAEQLNQEARQQTAKEIIEMIKESKTISEYNTLEMIGHPFNAQAVVSHRAISKEKIVDSIKSKYGIGE